jgi:hypothetical protein
MIPMAGLMMSYSGVFLKALLQVFPQVYYYIYLFSMLAGVLLWLIWFTVMDTAKSRQPYSIFFVWLWLCLSENFWQLLSVGLFRTTAMLSVEPFSHLVYWFGTFALHLFFVLAASQNLLINILVVIAMGFMSHQMESHDVDKTLDVFAEGEERKPRSPNSIQPFFDYQYGSYFSSFAGRGDYSGISRKRHLVPWVESAYTAGITSRLICGEKCYMVLICYDIFFDDWLDEAPNSDGMIIVSNLKDFENTPMLKYYEKQIEYLHLRSRLPLIYRDTLQYMTRGITP